MSLFRSRIPNAPADFVYRLPWRPPVAPFLFEIEHECPGCKVHFMHVSRNKKVRCEACRPARKQRNVAKHNALRKLREQRRRTA